MYLARRLMNVFRYINQAVSGWFRSSHGKPCIRHRNERSAFVINCLDACEKQVIYTQLAQCGIRNVPYPFDHALSIVNDNDRAQRQDYETYRDQIIYKYGLDFGDSCKLLHSTHQEVASVYNSPDDNRDERTFAEFTEATAIYDYDGNVFSDHASRNIDLQLTFDEVVQEWSRGNLDHFHGISNHGPRIVWIQVDIKCIDSRVSIQFPQLENRNKRHSNFNASILPISEIGIVLNRKVSSYPVMMLIKKDEYKGIECQLNTGRTIPLLPERGQQTLIYNLMPGANCKALSELISIDLEFQDKIDNVVITGIYITNMNRDLLLNLYEKAINELNIKTNLITDHASKVFLSSSGCEKRHEKINAERFSITPIPASYARVNQEGKSYSCLGDDPESIVYVLPDLVNKYGIRFINPSGISGESINGFDPLDVVVPSNGRDGTGIYCARRTRMPLLDDNNNKSVEDKIDQGTVTTPLRINRILKTQSEISLVFPFYTHLGNIIPKSKRTTPYYPEDIIGQLQNSVFGINKKDKEKPRFWFTRASILYDYCLMLRSLSFHVRRDKYNIYISSWYDETLKQKLPVSPEQLHGITFYTDNAWESHIFLNDEKLPDICLNPADNTGRQSITILGRGTEFIVFNKFYPEKFTNGFTGQNVTTHWIDDQSESSTGSGFVRIAIENKVGGCLSWNPESLYPYGSQYFGYTYRKSDESIKVGILVKTRSQGVFWFHDPDISPDKNAITAAYQFNDGFTEHWENRWLPFYDMQWNEKADPGGPLPSHGIRKITIFLQGEQGSYIDIDQIIFMRPSTLKSGM